MSVVPSWICTLPISQSLIHIIWRPYLLKKLVLPHFWYEPGWLDCVFGKQDATSVLFACLLNIQLRHGLIWSQACCLSIWDEPMPTEVDSILCRDVSWYIFGWSGTWSWMSMVFQGAPELMWLHWPFTGHWWHDGFWFGKTLCEMCSRQASALSECYSRLI